MRTFVAVILPENIRDYLYNLQKKIGNKNAKINWVAKKRIHLTMAFLGEITEDQVETIKTRLHQIKFKPIKVKLNNLGFSPNKQNPSCIWIDLIPDQEIKQLQMLVDQEIIDISPQSQEFKSHVTIGRIKGFKKKKDFLDSIELIKIEPLQFTLDSFELLKSELSRTGPKYKTIEEYVSK